jgi:succinate dehydrogenase/fumarate reductase flavoprotein subunit
MYRTDPLELHADVLVVGGGPAALWAAMSARAAGARTVLVDKGFAGASGVAAAATAGHWWVPPDPGARDRAMAERDDAGGGLSERSWMARVLDETWRRWPEIADDLAYPGPIRFPGAVARPTIEGPVYLRALRRRVSRGGVRILDHAPALELLVDADGAVAGAAGVQRQKDRAWRIAAGAVILATGGCTWRSGSLGSNVDTGDGYLMGAEVGAHLSGMEFSNYYGIVPAGTTMDKNGLYPWSTFTDADGETIAVGWSGPLGAIGPDPWDGSLIRAGVRGPVYAVLDRATADQRAAMRAGMPNYFMAFDRLGIDPFRERFEIEFIQEGTVRGTGGLALADDTCWTGVPGLWAAGDAATREQLVGGASGAGAANAAWTISSGTWSGTAAAAHARARPAPAAGLRAAGRVGLRPTSRGRADWRELSAATEAQLNPIERNGVRSEAVLAGVARELDALWNVAGEALGATDARSALRARETAAMIAVGRWATASARARTESRAIHVRDDFPATDPTQRDRVLSGGLDRVWVRRQAIAGAALEAAA